MPFAAAPDACPVTQAETGDVLAINAAHVVTIRPGDE
jgi:hypothetical protein